MDRLIHRFDRLDSTMHEAAELAANGCPEGTAVVASEQTSGQGRFDRTWYSPPGAGLYMSVVHRPKLCPDSLPVVTLAVGLAVADAIARTAGVSCDLRWPNDVLVHGKKCAGVLIQLQDGVLLTGIGVNVNHAAFPPDLEGTAISLRQATGREYSIEALLAAILEAIDVHFRILFDAGKDPILRMFTQASSYVRGRRVVVEGIDGDLRGSTEGLDPQGFLVLRRDDGKRQLVLAGGVRPECS